MTSPLDMAVEKHATEQPIESEKIIGSIIRNGQAVVIRLNAYQGRKYIDVRNFFRNKKDNKFYPTKKGISIQVQELSELISLLEKVEAEVVGDIQKAQKAGIVL